MTAQQAVLGELRRLIARGVLSPGAQVFPDEMAARLHTSRVPVREALKILEGEGQVLSTPHRGYFVAKLSVDDLTELYRIREILEKEAVQKALPRMTDDDRREIRELVIAVEEAAAADDVVAMIEANRAFHFMLFEPSGMPRLVRMIRILWESSDAYRAVYYGDPAHRAQVLDEHREILEAVDRREGPRLIKLLAQHRRSAAQQLRVVLEPSTDDDALASAGGAQAK
jgi:DNA-binding GntR family transcriptional regulator